MWVKSISRRKQLTRLERSSRCLLAGFCLAFLLICLATTAAAQTEVEPNPPSDNEQALFIKGQNLYNQNLYHEAIVVFGDFLKSYPQSQIKDMALLWLGRCQIRVGNVGAAEQIAVRLRELPDTQFVDLYEEELRVARQSLRRGDAPGLITEPAKSRPANPANLVTQKPAQQTISTTTSVTSTNSVVRPVAVNEPAIKPKVQPQVVKAEPLAIARPPAQLPLPKSVSTPTRTAVATGNTRAIVSIRREPSPRDSALNGVVFYRLLIVNEGPRVVRDLIVTEQLSDDLQFASSDPAPTKQEPVGRSQRLTFRIAELRPGTSRALRIAVRLRNNAPHSALNTTHFVSYQDAGKAMTVSNSN
jgi:hypothetical protein